ncbi:hypothetical protein I7I48_11085 [Histoplasma ohiense]|nr:hypothetical protein I7I48_11085 [Histoplasma ohiense (nom. inval.)]
MMPPMVKEERLVNEARDICATLALVDGEYIETCQNCLCPTPWQALISLHKRILHELHDFFRASQQPSAVSVLDVLRSKYSMQKPMWRHGIHSFLGLSCQHLLAFIDHMLPPPIYAAYLLLPCPIGVARTFEDTCIGCLHDLMKYRMTIEDIDSSDPEVWADSLEHWYSKVDRVTIRFRHHLVVLAHPNIFQQIYFSSMSLANAAYPRNVVSCLNFFCCPRSRHGPFRQYICSLADSYSNQQSSRFSEDVPHSTCEDLTKHNMVLEPNSFNFKAIHSWTTPELFCAFLTYFPLSVSDPKNPINGHDLGVWMLHKSNSHVRAVNISPPQLWIIPRLAFLFIFSILLPFSSARPIEQAAQDEMNHKTLCKLGADDIVLLVLAAFAVPVCLLLGQRLGQPRTFGTSMVVFNIANLMTSGDPLVSTVGHWVGLGLSFAFTAIFAGMLAKRFRHITRSFAHTIPFLLVVWIVNYLLHLSSAPGRSRTEQSDSDSQYLLSSVAFTLICWWKIAEWSIQISPTVETNATDTIPVNIYRSSHN